MFGVAWDDENFEVYVKEEYYDNYLSVGIDACSCGVGGDMPGYACLREPYILHPWKTYTFKFRITSVN